MKDSKSMRVWYALMALVLWTGIYLTGFSVVSWVFYIPASASVIAVITGICPSLDVISKIFSSTAK